MMLDPERGISKIVIMNLISCTIGSFLILACNFKLFLNYIAYGLTGMACMYLFSRYIISSVNFLSKHGILASSAFYASSGFLSGSLTLFGIFSTIYSGKISAIAYTSFISLGSEFGEYRKIKSRKNIK